MTRRGAALLLAAAGLALWGWRANWPELMGLGAGAVVLVIFALLATLRTPRGTVRPDQASVQVVRGQPAEVRLTVDLRGPHRWLRVVDGPVRAPLRSVRLPRSARRTTASLLMPVDTRERGQRALGPYSLVHGDPWGIVRRVVASADGGVLTVRPRSFRMRRSLTTAFREGESDAASRRTGDQHFHALRDYVLGDEPRSVHWRSSARAGKLVVRQQVSEASTGTTIVLDVDGSAYATSGRFSTNWDADRFEAAVEVAASLATSQLGRTEQVHLLTTARGARVTSASAGAAGSLLDALAVVRLLPPVDTAADELPAVVARTRAAHTIVVTSAPDLRTAGALRRLATVAPLTVVRVGAGATTAGLPGARVVDVPDAVSLGEL
ncbi:DUF58 domain-containing protein [Nocardioides sp.]|uniref:DUF58 domain-containing protein n=1 Tax=Nocardioides sp. TaxID=35761 RepID=UPI002612E731|nr:DUF58 domain-containing protein [Nocardioides sp.]MDI6910886.1 DUF58 domain-containing protein [Nocardioides sp.]